MKWHESPRREAHMKPQISGVSIDLNTGLFVSTNIYILMHIRLSSLRRVYQDEQGKRKNCDLMLCFPSVKDFLIKSGRTKSGTAQSTHEIELCWWLTSVKAMFKPHPIWKKKKKSENNYLWDPIRTPTSNGNALSIGIQTANKEPGGVPADEDSG